MNLTVKISNFEFKNPVTVASGTFGHSEEYYGLDEVKQLGAIIPKTITLHKREGNPPPRIVETSAGMLNAIGIENPGADEFIKNKFPSLKKIGIPVIVSILGHHPDEFIELAKKLNEADGMAALELNLSCPNIQSQRLVAQDPQATAQIVKAVKNISRLPVIAKLSPNVTDITDIALAAQEAGADGLSLINTLSGMAIDPRTRRSMLGNVTGGLSGPAIKPVALRMVYEVYRKVKIPIIGMGGIMTANDALEFLIAGATMVAVGTANFINPRAPVEILAGIRNYLKQNKMTDIKEIIGSLK